MVIAYKISLPHPKLLTENEVYEEQTDMYFLAFYLVSILRGD